MESIEKNQQIYRAAKQFFNAAELLWEGDRSQHIYPIVVNFALACEIALKSVEAKVVTPEVPDGVLMADTTVVSCSWGHKLSKIFLSLTPDNQKNLESEYGVYASGCLLADLEKCDEYFVTARYPWEPDNKTVFSLTHVKQLAKNLLLITRHA